MRTVMRRGGACVLAAAAVSAGFAFAAVPAHADPDDNFFGQTECGGSSCEVEAHSPGDSGSGGGQGGGSASGGGSSGQSASTLPEPECSLPGVGQAECEGALMSEPGVGGGGAAPVDWAAEAESVRASMSVPAPVVGGAPPLGGEWVVHVPGWLWVEPEVWEPVSAEASVGAGSVSVTAEPARVEWAMGDGQTVVCHGPGTALNEDTYRDGGSPDCGHTYTSLPSEGEFEVSARVVWAVSWESSAGEGGELGELSSSTAEQVGVVEVHALVVRG